MLLSCTAVDKCRIDQNEQCVKDCCHLEGDTPIEIRIAYAPPSHPARGHGPSVPQLAGLNTNLTHGLYRAGRSGGGYNYKDPFDGRHLWAPQTDTPPADPISRENTTAWARQADLMHPAALGSTRWSQRTFNSDGSDGVDPGALAHLASTIDSKQSALAGVWQVAPARMISVPEVNEDDFFPEIIRSERKKSREGPLREKSDIPCPPQSSVPSAADPCAPSPKCIEPQHWVVSEDAENSPGVPMWTGMVKSGADIQRTCANSLNSPQPSRESSEPRTPVDIAQLPNGPKAIQAVKAPTPVECRQWSVDTEEFMFDS